MKIQEFREFLATYQGLADRAKTIISGAPYFTSCSAEFGSLDFAERNE